MKIELLREWLDGYPFVSHQAAQAGVQTSWSRRFEGYARHNIRATQRLLEAAREVPVWRFVYGEEACDCLGMVRQALTFCSGVGVGIV